MPRRRKSTEIGKEPWQSLPSVAALLDLPQVAELASEHSRPMVLDAINEALARFRTKLTARDAPPTIDRVVAGVREALDETRMYRLGPVVNATGIILHTGLGRAVLPRKAVDALALLDRCCNLQIDLATGLRGQRDRWTEVLLTRSVAPTGCKTACTRAAPCWSRSARPTRPTCPTTRRLSRRTPGRS
ncbi:MAG: hypothetical protein HY815_25950 [Candidatus Riflebacteria bacterium]|nr:hypothetical protein [Candidatus Riflebacteria bacterium]